jgi:hypothetical protein
MASSLGLLLVLVLSNSVQGEKYGQMRERCKGEPRSCSAAWFEKNLKAKDSCGRDFEMSMLDCRYTCTLYSGDNADSRNCISGCQLSQEMTLRLCREMGSP